MLLLTWDIWDSGVRWEISYVCDVLCQAGMISCGIEPASRGSEFASVEHALEHFAHAVVVLGGACGNVSGTQGSGAVLQGAEDGLPLGREGGAGMWEG